MTGIPQRWPLAPAGCLGSGSGLTLIEPEVVNLFMDVLPVALEGEHDQFMVSLNPAQRLAPLKGQALSRTLADGGRVGLACSRIQDQRWCQ